MRITQALNIKFGLDDKDLAHAHFPGTEYLRSRQLDSMI